MQLNVDTTELAWEHMWNVMLTKFILFHSKIDYVQVNRMHIVHFIDRHFFAASYNETVQNLPNLQSKRNDDHPNADGGTTVEQPWNNVKRNLIIHLFIFVFSLPIHGIKRFYEKKNI